MKRLTALATLALAVSTGAYGQTSIHISLKQGVAVKVRRGECRTEKFEALRGVQDS